MTSNVDIIHFASHLITIVLLLSAPPILVASTIGIFVSLIQALTQIQESTLSFAIKLVAVLLTIALTASWTGAEIYNYAVRAFALVGQL